MSDTALSVSTAQISAQLETLLAKYPMERAVAIRSRTRQSWPDRIRPRGKAFELRWCDSLLGLRQALIELEASPTSDVDGFALLTPFATHELPDDIVARIAKAQVWQPEGWAIVREMFGAREVDARLGRHGWMPQLLIDGATSEPYAPVSSGILDLDTAWREILKRCLNLDGERPDALSLLAWSQQPDAVVTLQRLPDEARKDVCAWLESSAGLVGKLLLAAARSNRLADAFPLGLVCSVITAPEASGQPAIANAAVRLERYVDDLHVGIVEAQAWATASADLLARQGFDACQGSVERADRLLNELRAGEFAWFSDLLVSGFDQRVQRFASALTSFLTEYASTEKSAGISAALALVEQRAADVLRHGLAGRQSLRAEQVAMATRLTRWMSRDKPALGSAAAGAVWQADEGAFVDWARFRLLGGDDSSEVSRSFGALREAVAALREPLNRDFARKLSDGLPANERVCPVESALSDVIAPLARQHPVLMLVMDGLSVSIFRELFAEVAQLGWTEWVREDLGAPMVGLAALPTTTETSRSSLLTGAISVGASAQEKPGFAAHPALLSVSKQQLPPRLFHKAELADGGSLSERLREAVLDPQQKVVGVVYNAVDDHLSGPDQLHQSWKLSEMRWLLPLLREARDAGRVLVVTADHGHLLEDGTRQCDGGDRDRWRLGQVNDPECEVRVHGSRVLTREGAREVVCLWSERVRYTGRKNGYHGGASLAEVTVPMSVLLPLGVSLDGWQPTVPPFPEWWDLRISLAQADALDQHKQSPLSSDVAGKSRRSTVRKRAAAPEEQGRLFDLEAPVAATEGADAGENWIRGMLASETYLAQRQLAARVAIPNEQMEALLGALDSRGGKLTRSALAQRLGVTEMRLTGMLSATRRVLNVDQAQVIQVDELAGTVVLNLPLLIEQFRLNRKAG